MSNVLTMIMAGGEGSRLKPLTSDRTKPAVPFGGNYRIIDFVLSNFVNSGFMKIFVLTQFKSHSLLQHMREGWRVSSGIVKQFIDPVPAQMRIGKKWYEGTADAIFQNMNLIDDEDPDQVCIFGGDHIYRMDVRQMLRFHSKRQAVLTVAAIRVPIQDAHHFGIIEVDEEWRMTGFVEKPENAPKTIPGNPDYVLASMGNYIFERGPLVDELKKDSKDKNSDHDFGKNILPKMFPEGNVFVYDFSQNFIPGLEEEEKGYWKDVGTLDTYWEANMDLVGVHPHFNLYNKKWPVLTYIPPLPPAKFVHFSDLRTGHAINSMISSGAIISGALVENSVVGYNVRIHSFAHVEHSVIMNNVSIGRGAKIRKTIIDKHVQIASEVQIGYDLEADKKRFEVTENGVVVIPKGAEVV
ncbi:MAG: glucose-1-phosphate adenylyltransferase [SAR324 cluster bacterium]|jgi:glucose-1-phosphate adenylyltransferase|nr:glucose-1-phosphate adenylyltransferase [SAR324 cluster bacterium]|tara:strand:- start:973 stop:2202 length:1230 start_codon:yes stop_codon:yes gene_type:complete